MASLGACRFGYACYSTLCEWGHPQPSRTWCRDRDGCVIAQCPLKHSPRRRVCFYGTACREATSGRCTRLHPPTVDDRVRPSRIPPGDGDGGGAVGAPRCRRDVLGDVGPGLPVPPQGVPTASLRAPSSLCAPSSRPGSCGPSRGRAQARGDGIMAPAGASRGVVTTQRVESVATRWVQHRTNVGTCLYGAAPLLRLCNWTCACKMNGVFGRCL